MNVRGKGSARLYFFQSIHTSAPQCQPLRDELHLSRLQNEVETRLRPRGEVQVCPGPRWLWCSRLYDRSQKRRPGPMVF